MMVFAVRANGRTVNMRLIDADLLYKAMQDAEELARRRVRDTDSTLPYPTNLNPAYTRYLAQMDERTKAKKMVADATTVDAVPVRHGHWIDGGYLGNDNRNYMCSVCGAGETHTLKVTVRYCWNCGARMDGKGDGD